MCGIAGVVGEFRPGLAARMNAVQAHRGPNGAGVFEDPQAEVALGHVRLSILDLSNFASQPMTTADGRFTLIFNGEIYNFVELRRGLESRGCRFKSTGDTEVLLQGLAVHGPAFVERLNGMFAFALWDAHERTLLIARDHLGIKPLYYAEPAPGVLVFASELKAVCAHPGVRREPDFQAIEQHLSFCHTSGDRTAIQSIRRVPPASALRWSAKERRCRIERYWQPSYGARSNLNRAEAVEELREAVSAATRRQMVSDVPVGALLSGGLDSSLITACAAGVRTDFQCFTIVWSESQNQLDQVHADGPYAHQLARKHGLPLEEISIGADAISLWEKLLFHLDEPIADPAAIACYLICRHARQMKTPVLLSGQGADELFGGYPRYRVMQYMTRYFDRAPQALRRLAARGAKMLPGSWSGAGGATLRRVRRALSDCDVSPRQRFLGWCAPTPFGEVRSLWGAEAASELNGTWPTDECLAWMDHQNHSEGESFLDRDLSIYLPNHNLLYTDKMGMAVGIEARVPLLDMELVNLATEFPMSWKVGRNTKDILRDAARGVIPDDLIDRPKAGFSAPYRSWLRNDLGGLWSDLTSDTSVKQRGWFDPRALADIRKRSQSGRDDLYMLQWGVLSLELWARQFLDRNPADVELPGWQPNTRAAA